MWLLSQTCGGVKFHSAGREDMDVRMLGSGRPFVLEIVDAKVALSDTACEVRRGTESVGHRTVLALPQIETTHCAVPSFSDATS